MRQSIEEFKIKSNRSIKLYADKAKKAAHLKGGKVVGATLVVKTKKVREEDRRGEIKGKRMLIPTLRIYKRGS